MKIQLQAKPMRTILENLFKVVNQTSVLPILSSVFIEVKDKKVQFTVTDLETTLQYVMDTETEGELKFCIESKLLISFLKNSTEDICTLEISDKHKFTLKSGLFSARIQGNPNDFNNTPITPVIENAKTFNVEHCTLSPKIMNALKFASRDYLRPALAGVFFEIENNKLTIAATDAHSLYWEEVCKIEQPIESFIIPGKSAQLFNSNFKDKMVSVFVNETHVAFKSDTTTLICRKIDSRYPAYKTVIPTTDQSFFMKRKQLISLIIMSTEYVNRATSMTKFKVSNDTIKASADDVDFGIEFDYTIPIYNSTNKTSKYEFAVNLKFLKRILDLNKDELIKVSHTSVHTKALVIDDKFLLMPLMLNN